jgi:hypothetical protein
METFKNYIESMSEVIYNLYLCVMQCRIRCPPDGPYGPAAYLDFYTSAAPSTVSPHRRSPNNFGLAALFVRCLALHSLHNA